MTVQTIKFSEFLDGLDLKNGETTVGLLGGANAKFNNPWTFLAPGSTGARPVPSADINYRLRLNTTLNVYEYYDPISMTWTQLSGSGTGTVNPGVINDIPFYPANGTTLSPITAAANSVLVTNAGSVPSLSTTLPTGLSIPGATITASTAALNAGSVVAAPVAGSDLVNKTYADGLYTASVHSITGTTNQVIASSPTGDVTLSLPQDIATGSSPTFSALHLSASTPHAVLIGQGASPINSVLLGAGQVLIGTTSGDPAAAAINSGQNILVGNASGSITVSFNGILPSANGGTGVNNGSSTITLGGSLTTSGAFASTFTMTNTTNVTFPTSGTLATVGGTVSSITGTANQIAASASTGAVTLSIVSNPILPGTGGFTLPTGNTAARAGGAGTMRFNSQTSVFECTVDGAAWATIETASTGVTSVSGTANRITSTGGTTPVIDISASYVGQSSITTLGTITTGVWTGTNIALANGGTNASLTASNGGIFYSTGSAGAILSGTATAGQMLQSGASAAPTWSTTTYPATNAINTLLYASSANAMAALATANSSVLVTSAGGVPSLSTALPSGLTATNMSLTTPTLGVATATSINKVAITAPATSATLTIADGKTLTVSNTLTFTGTDSSSVNFGAGGTVQYAAGAGGLKSFQIFTSGTAATYTRPAGITSILVEVLGGGGGGGGATGSAVAVSAGGGGGGGGYCRKYIASASSTYTYTVGAAANGGAAGNNNGTAGNASSFSTLTANGGGAGGGDTTHAALAAGGTAGAGGTASGGDINITGGAASAGLNTNLNYALQGAGGSSQYGAATIPLYVLSGNTSGGASGNTNQGNGGCGGAQNANATGAAGGTGGAGLIIVWEYS